MSQASSSQAHRAIRLALPKGRMHEGVFALLADAGIRLRAGSRGYRPSINLENFEVKILKPQSIIEMLHVGSRDIGFCRRGLVCGVGCRSRRTARYGHGPGEGGDGGPSGLVGRRSIPQAAVGRGLGVHAADAALVGYASNQSDPGALLRCDRGPFRPRDADAIVDNTATGSTLIANGLQITHTLMTSSTRLYAHPRVLDDAERRSSVERFVLLVRSVLEARSRVMLEVNVTPEVLEAVVAILPSMREATVSPLHMARGFAVKSAIRRDELHRVIPEIKARGGTDIVVTALAQIVP